MEVALYIFFGTSAVALLGWLIIPRINGRVSAGIASEHAKRTLRREFLAFVIEFRTHIITTNNPEIWVNIFTQNVSALKAEFNKISMDLSGADEVKMHDAIDSVMAYANMNPGDIYADKDKLVEAFSKFPDI